MYEQCKQAQEESDREDLACELTTEIKRANSSAEGDGKKQKQMNACVFVANI